MAGKIRYWKEKDGGFYARLAVPMKLRPFLDRPRGELNEHLGTNRREALRKHPAAVARLQAELDAAKHRADGSTPALGHYLQQRAPLTTADFGRAVWQRYTEALAADEKARQHHPDQDEIAAAQQQLLNSEAVRTLDHSDPLAVLDATVEFLAFKNRASLEAEARVEQLRALKKALATNQLDLIEHEVEAYLDRYNLRPSEGTAERKVLAQQLLRAEIESVSRMIERDHGDYSGQPADPIVRATAEGDWCEPVSLVKLFEAYRDYRVRAGFMRDNGKRQEPVIRNFITYLGHGDANRITRKDVISWRDHLLEVQNLAPKTVSDIYLSAIRSVLGWAFENERLKENVAERVRQAKPNKQSGRAKGYTDAEAIVVLNATLQHQPKPNQFGYIRETAHMTAAKRWTPFLAAFSGARISEITQLRKEDIRIEADRWIMRITPEAGSVKSGDFRDVPLHRQLVALGFPDYVASVESGPLFHGATDPEKYATAAQSISDELAKWLRGLGVVPEGVRPNYGWRHRMKTQALELGLTMRVIDAIQGHSSRTAGENYGDVTIAAKARVIDELPDYEIAL